MRTLKFLLEKEFKQVLRNPIILPLIIVLPTLQLAVLPFAATYEIRNVDLVLIDNDQSSFSKELTAKINASQYFQIVNSCFSYEEALADIHESKASLIVEIPEDFEKDLRLNKNVEIQISSNAVDGTKASLGTSYVNQIIMDFARDINRKIMLSNPQFIQEKLPNIQIVPQFKYNSELNFTTYMVPGIIVMMITLSGGILTVLNIVSEKEEGTQEQINVSPVKKQYYLLAKLIPFWILGIISVSIGFIVARLLFDISIVGNIPLVYMFATIYMMAFSGFGLLISVRAKNQQQSMFIAFFFLMIFFLMGGLFTPISSMPHWAQILTLFNPTAFMVDVLRLIILKGSGFADLHFQFFMICLFAVIFNLSAILVYKKTS